jgi:hypothetical protein
LTPLSERASGPWTVGQAQQRFRWYRSTLGADATPGLEALQRAGALAVPPGLGRREREFSGAFRIAERYGLVAGFASLVLLIAGAREAGSPGLDPHPSWYASVLMLLATWIVLGLAVCDRQRIRESMRFKIVELPLMQLYSAELRQPEVLRETSDIQHSCTQSRIAYLTAVDDQEEFTVSRIAAEFPDLSWARSLRGGILLRDILRNAWLCEFEGIKLCNAPSHPSSLLVSETEQHLRYASGKGDPGSMLGLAQILRFSSEGLSSRDALVRKAFSLLEQEPPSRRYPWWLAPPEAEYASERERYFAARHREETADDINDLRGYREQVGLSQDAEIDELLARLPLTVDALLAHEWSVYDWPSPELSVLADLGDDGQLAPLIEHSEAP